MSASTATATVSGNSTQSSPAPVPLKCYKISTRIHSAARDFIVKKYCKWKVVYRIFPPNEPPLDACNVHFNEYFESHEIGPEMVMRLSDDEDDFIQAGHNKRDADESEQRCEPEPICQVPKPKPRSTRK